MIDLAPLGTPTRPGQPASQGLFAVAGDIATSSAQNSTGATSMPPQPWSRSPAGNNDGRHAYLPHQSARMVNMAICVFCGSQATLTREHVLPQWVRSLPPGEGPFTIRRVAETGKAVEYRCRGVDIVTRVVCGDCNGGWMADLEATAMPLLSPMINGGQRSMTPDEQRLVSRWAVKTAIMFLYATQPRFGVSPQHRACLFEGKLPPNTGIWLARYRADPPAYNSWIRARVIEMRQPSQPEATHAGQSVTLTLGYYVQQVLLTPPQWFGQSFTFTTPTALERRVLPIPQEGVAQWPPAAAVGTDELERNADAFGGTGINTPVSESNSR
jgi:hypothetical protein